MNFIRKNKTIILTFGIIVIVYILNKKIIHQNLKNIYKKILTNYENFNNCSDENNARDNIVNINVGKNTAPTFY